MNDNRDPVRVLGRIKQKQWDARKTAADLLGISFTEFAKNALDMRCKILRAKLREVDQIVKDRLAKSEAHPQVKPKEPRRKLPKQVHHKGTRKTK